MWIMIMMVDINCKFDYQEYKPLRMSVRESLDWVL